MLEGKPVIEWRLCSVSAALEKHIPSAMVQMGLSRSCVCQIEAHDHSLSTRCHTLVSAGGGVGFLTTRLASDTKFQA